MNAFINHNLAHGLFADFYSVAFSQPFRNAAFMPQPNGDINVYNICAFNANVAR